MSFRWCIVLSVILFRLAALWAQVSAVPFQTFTLEPRPHIRALEVINDSTVWFAANRGMWGYTRDGGKSWHIDSLKIDTISPQFRSIAVLNDSTVLLLSIQSPALLLKTSDRGKTWRTVYRDNRKGIFFDSMVFSDHRQGFAIGDPIEGCFQVITTTDGGETWGRLACNLLPAAEEGEACFATSNSNIVASGENVWFVTGGKYSRVFYSDKPGRGFKVFEAPLPAGETMTGIFSCDFYDRSKGVITGGNYDKTDSTIISLAVTEDSGNQWRPVKTSRPFFGSSVKFFSPYDVILTGHDGTFSVNLHSGVTTEITAMGEKLRYHVLRFSSGGKSIWLAGSNGRIAVAGKPWNR